MNALDHALTYAAAGFPVFPANPVQKPAPYSKAPFLPKESAPGRRDGGHWLASGVQDVICGWWRRWPLALIGFPTGLRTRCVVIDLDPKDVPVAEMLAALTEWCRQLMQVDPLTGEVCEPAIARTQSGGLHLYFAWPDEAIFGEIANNLTRLGKPVTGLIGNKANVFSGFLKVAECPAALAHIDVRGEGGYVIAPPSEMADGAAYEWIIPRADRLPPLPRRLRGVITGEFLTDAERAERRAAARRRPALFDGRDISDRRVKAYIERAIAGALSDARSAPQGERNERVHRAAVSLSRFVRSGHLPRSDAESLLLANLPAGVNPAEAKIRGTIASGLGASVVPAFSPEQLSQGRVACA
jgi:putative DNA primase/helicase